MKPFSLDLRERVVAVVDAGQESQSGIAQLFGVSLVWVKKLLRRRRRTGSIMPLPHGGGHPPRLQEKQLEALRQAVATRPDATLAELQAKVRGADRQRVSLATLCRALTKLGLTKKKRPLSRKSKIPKNGGGTGNSLRLYAKSANA